MLPKDWKGGKTREKPKPKNKNTFSPTLVPKESQCPRMSETGKGTAQIATLVRTVEKPGPRTWLSPAA